MEVDLTIDLDDAEFAKLQLVARGRATTIEEIIRKALIEGAGGIYTPIEPSGTPEARQSLYLDLRTC